MDDGQPMPPSRARSVAYAAGVAYADSLLARGPFVDTHAMNADFIRAMAGMLNTCD